MARARWLSALAGGLLACGLASAPPAFAASTSAVNLGHASSYAVISGASVANTGNSTVRGDIGAPATPSGFPPGVIVGSMHVGSADATAYNDFLTAYAEVQGRTGGAALPALDGATLTPGLYTSAAAAGMAASTVLTLDAGGNPNAVFVIQVNGALSLGAGAKVKLTGGARASDVFWGVNGGFSIGASGQFAGTVLASGAGGVGAGSLVNGRLLVQAAATTNDDDFYSAPPTVTLAGGAAADINTSAPVLSGTTDVGTSGLVTVTVAGQTLTATPAQDGSWSVAPTKMANGTYSVQASTSDGAGNVGSATQRLTVDTVPPRITLDGAPSVLTNSATPTIAGTTDAAPGTLVIVDVEAQTLTAVVNGTTIVQSVGAQTLAAVIGPGGNWNVRPAHLGEGSRTVTAAVTDPAGNTSTASEQLTVDTGVPVSSTRTPTSGPTPQAPAALTLSSHTLTAQQPVKVRFTLAKRETVAVTLAHTVHGKRKVVGTVLVKVPRAGRYTFKLGTRFAGHKLTKGSYTLILQTVSGKRHSKTVTRKVWVR